MQRVIIDRTECRKESRIHVCQWTGIIQVRPLVKSLNQKINFLFLNQNIC